MLKTLTYNPEHTIDSADLLDVAATPRAAGSSATVQPVPRIARFLPSLTDIAFLMPIFFIFIKLNGARKLLGDGDTGWHIRTGEWIIAHGQVPHTDMFSFSRPGAEWFAWEWLWDVLFAMLHGKWGMGSVVLASLVLICFTSAMLFRLVRRKCGNGLVAIAVTLLATGGCAIHWLARPHLFTMFFLVATLHITERAAEGRTRLLGWLVPLTLLWVNLHGGFFVIFLILATYLGNLAVQAAIDSDAAGRRRYLAAMKPWLLAGAACFAVTFVNPYGWKLHQHMATYLVDPYNMKYIAEFQSVNFHAPVVVYFEPLLIAGLLISLWNIRRRRFQEVFLTLGWMQLAFVAQRNIPLFSIAVAPVVAQGLMALLGSARNSGLANWLETAPAAFLTLARGTDETDRIGRVHLVSALSIALIGTLLLLPKPVGDKFAVDYDPNDYPEKALPILLESGSRRIFADDEWGDYLLYRMYPKRQVFVDGRSDFYGDDFCAKYQKLLSVDFGFQKIFDEFAIDTVVLPPQYALTTALKLSPVWRVVYDDHISVVFRRRTGLPVSAASNSVPYNGLEIGGIVRDRTIAKTSNRDLSVTKPNPKS